MSGELKIDREYIILAGSDVVKVKVLDLTATSIRVHNLDDDFTKRYLLEDYKPRVIEEVGEIDHEKERVEILDAVNKPVLSDIEHPTKALILGKSNTERLAEILQVGSAEEVAEELIKEDKEIWKEIPNMGCPYWLSNKGRVKNRHNKLLKQATVLGKTYYYLTKKDKSTSSFSLDLLLQEIFKLTKVI